MGEIAEGMLDGTYCEGCAVYLGGDEFGVPLVCGTCARERRQAGRDIQRLGQFFQDCGEHETQGLPGRKVRCEKCGRLVKRAGLADHERVMHAQPATP